MAIIQTRRNQVIAREPEPDDILVRISLIGPADDGIHLQPRHLWYEPIAHYQSAVEWAVSMADKMAYPIHVVTLNYRDVRNTGRFGPICAAVASMTDQERGEMRQAVIATCAEIMRDCPIQQVREDAYDVLVELKVVRK